MSNELKNNFNITLNDLIKESIHLEHEINSVDEKSKKLLDIKKEIELMQEQLRKSAFEALLDKYDNIIELYPKHDIEMKNLNVEDALKAKMCSDKEPFNVTTCKRCAIIYLQKYIEKEMANYFIM